MKVPCDAYEEGCEPPVRWAEDECREYAAQVGLLHRHLVLISRYAELPADGPPVTHIELGGRNSGVRYLVPQLVPVEEVLKLIEKYAK